MPIRINVPDTRCWAGTTIAGTVSLYGEQDIDIEDISIVLLARCKTKVRKSSGNSSTTYRRCLPAHDLLLLLCPSLNLETWLGNDHYRRLKIFVDQAGTYVEMITRWESTLVRSQAETLHRAAHSPSGS